MIYRLGTWRTYYIEIDNEDVASNGARLKDANEVLYFIGKERVLYYIGKPFEVPVENVSDLSQAEDFDIEKAAAEHKKRTDNAHYYKERN